MLNVTECKAQAVECKLLGIVSGTSVRRAKMLEMMARTLTGLASQIGRYNALVKDEELEQNRLYLLPASPALLLDCRQNRSP
jgi:hypothetical protein